MKVIVILLLAASALWAPVGEAAEDSVIAPKIAALMPSAGSPAPGSESEPARTLRPFPRFGRDAPAVLALLLLAGAFAWANFRKL